MTENKMVCEIDAFDPYPCKIEMRFVVSAHAVICHLLAKSVGTQLRIAFREKSYVVLTLLQQS